MTCILDRSLVISDGQSWGEPLMTHTSAFNGPNRLGLFVCSGNTFASTTAESVTVSQ